MAKNNNLSDFLKDLADTIRAKTGRIGLLNPQDFSTIISNSFNNEEREITITENRTYNLLPTSGSGYTGISKATIIVDVPIGNSYDTLHNPTKYSGEENLKRVEIIEGVDTVGKNAFSRSTNVEEIVLPSSITTYEENSLSGPTGIKLVMYSNIPSSFYNKTQVNVKDLVVSRKKLPGTSNTYKGCDNIYSNSFIGCTSIESFNAGERTLRKYKIGDDYYGGSIEAYAFKECTNLETVNISVSSCVEIGYEAFSECINLDGIFKAPSSLRTIYQNSFWNCKKLSGYDFTAVNAVVDVEGYTDYHSLYFPSGYVWSYPSTGKYEPKPWEYVTERIDYDNYSSSGHYDHAPKNGEYVTPHDKLYDESGNEIEFKVIVPLCHKEGYESHDTWKYYKLEFVDVKFDETDQEVTTPPSGDEGGESTETSTTAAPESGTSE